MTFWRDVAHAFFRWIDGVAIAIVDMLGWFGSSRMVRLLEETDGAFSVQIPAPDSSPLDGSLRIVAGSLVGTVPESVATMLKASRVELILQPSHFLFRPIELPQRASEFLVGVVRAQIDRLTPWSAVDATFGCSAPSETANGRIVVTVAATAREFVAQYVRAIAGLGADSIVVSTIPEEPEAAPITVLSQRIRHGIETHRVQRIVLGVLIAGGMVAAAAIGLDTVLAGYLEGRQDDLARRIAEHRASVLANREAGSTSALEVLAQRKHSVPSTVIVLEALSQILPDHTYVTELRIEGDKMQILGLTQDAPSLIRLIEQSSHFSRATFSAPTTRSPSDAGERFHIDAQIQPVYTTGS